jgi:hypothetical protein
MRNLTTALHKYLVTIKAMLDDNTIRITLTDRLELRALAGDIIRLLEE